jgi:uncharacterized protein YuzE
MVTTNDTMDDHSLEICREGKLIGLVLWHANREPKIELFTGGDVFVCLKIQEIEQILENYKQARKMRGN